jgi:hypothetical protein
MTIFFFFFFFLSTVYDSLSESHLFSVSFIFPGLSIDEFSRKKLDLTAEELSEEKALAYSCLS